MKIYIDAGHGGTESGAVANGIVEKDINLIVSNEVIRLLKRHENIEVLTTRTNDTTISLGERTTKANNLKADFFISIHHNAGQGDGYEIIHALSGGKGKELAESIAKEFDKLGQNRRRVFARESETTKGKNYYHVINATNMPSIITEFAFIDSKDREIVDTNEELIAEANAIYNGIINFLRIPNHEDIKINTPIGYSKIKLYDSDVHIYTTNKNEDVDVTLGQVGKLEPLSKITDPNKYIVAKTNGGFFNLNGSCEHLGTYVDEGKYYTPNNPIFIDFIYFKDGHTEVKFLKDINEIAYVQGNSKWTIGTSWSLVINGQINIINADKIDHSGQKHPRTLLGQKKDGTFILAVVQGRTSNSVGVNAQQSADIMYKLGCWNAVNLDGGGSSEMIVNDQIKNSPTDGCERKIGSAIIVYDKNKKVDSTIYKITPTLKKGDKGDNVINLQKSLNKLGYSLVTDGDFGNKTDTTVRDFQKKKGLVVDGIVGKNTINMILKSL